MPNNKIKNHPSTSLRTRKLKVKTAAVKAKTKAAKQIKEVKTEKPVRKAGIAVKVYGKEGKAVGEISLPKEIFGAKINDKLLAQYVRVYLANQRQGTASVKTRGEVRGSTRKIYRQKGTGRARHGAITAPIFVGGGIVFGPEPRDFSLKLTKKMKKIALFSALSLKLKNNQVFVLDNLNDMDSKTKGFAKIIKNLNLSGKKRFAEKILFVLPGKRENLERAAGNIKRLKIEKANLLNTYEVLNNKYLLLMKDSIEKMESFFLKK